MVPARTAGSPLTLKMRPETVTEAPKPPEVTKNPARGQVCAHSTSSVTLLPSQTTLLIRPQKKGMDPVTLDTKASADFRYCPSTCG